MEIHLKKSTIAAVALSLAMTGFAVADDALVFTSDMTEGKIFALANMLAKSGSSELDFVAAEADFNDDGRKDVLAFAQTSYFCGSGGCGPVMMIATKNGWEEVPFNGLAMPENWYLLDHRTKGYRDIAVLGDDSETIYRWDGGAYVEEN